MPSFKLKIPQECKTNPAIDHVLTYKYEKGYLETACQEYEDLLTFEHYFKREDNNKVSFFNPVLLQLHILA